ncbi:ABC-type multidrug transport system, ATPase component [Actinoalloteichus sp. GBA129-24]|nr:ABC-type multidrug transport system, ATPase component [Actinoalloteichus sp. GBA129-24]
MQRVRGRPRQLRVRLTASGQVRIDPIPDIATRPPRYRDRVLSVRGLTKVYGGRRVVDDVSFELRPGTVTAFLGPNGAGKSTTLRMISGLTIPDAGESFVAGRPFTRWANPAQVAGVLLDAAAVHPGRTGRGHLRNAALLAGLPARRVDEVLSLVGLGDAGGKRIAAYSLGMRQRLGMAQALLTNPPMLILDEPINGLDPEGIRSVRQLLRGYAERGGTALLSSHVLSEVDQTADRVLVIGAGRIVADGPLSELTNSHRALVRAPDMNRLASVLTAAGIAIQPAADGHLAAHASVDRVSEVTFNAGVRLLGLAQESVNLEDLFFRLTGESA